MKDTLSNILLLPFRLVQGIVTRDFSKADQILVSWSPTIFSVNDHAAFYPRRFSFDRYGYWGYCSRFGGGANFGAGYAFLSNFLTWKLGISGYILFSILIYFSYFTILAILTPPFYFWVMITGLMALYSPYFKNSTFNCGRHDVPGWAFLLMGFYLLISNHYNMAFIALTLAFMTHPSISIVGFTYFFLFIMTGHLDKFSILSFCSAQAINLFWYIPYIRTYGRKNITHSWTPPGRDETRSAPIYLRKGFGMLCFLLCLFWVKTDQAGYIFACVPFGLFLLNCWRDAYVNRFSIELLWICGAAAAVARTESPWLSIVYLFSLYLYASPAPRFSFPYKPLLIEKTRLSEVFSPISNTVSNTARVAYISFPETADMYRLDAQILTLVNKGLVSQSNRIEIFGFRLSPENENPNAIDFLASLPEKYSVSYILTPKNHKKHFDSLSNFEKIKEFTLFSVGSLPENELLLYEATRFSPHILPEGSIRERVEGGFMVDCMPGRHEVKYQALKGLRAFQDSNELLIEPGEDCNFFFTADTAAEIVIKQDTKSLWLSKKMIPLKVKSKPIANSL